MPNGLALGFMKNACDENCPKISISAPSDPKWVSLIFNLG
jgi:hypothetical protein